jgi:hypothetical protein
MSWALTGGVMAGLMATGSAALLLAVWMATRLRCYRSAGGELNPETMTLAMAGPPRGLGLMGVRGFVEGLLGDTDVEFLAAQAGYRREIGRTLRRERMRIFRLYLVELAREFHQTHARARAAVANSSEECSGVVEELMRQEWSFWRAMIRIELSLAAARVNARRFGKARRSALAGLMETMDAMRLDLAHGGVSRH